MGDYMERKRIEVEAKFPLINKKYTVEKLEEVASKVEKTKQKDIYYTPAHEDFLERDPICEWFRLRFTDNEKVITYKNWSNNGKNNKISCKEIEVGIDDYDGMLEILKSLDFRKIIEVDKARSSFEYKGIIISIDSIKDLGDFIELEFKSNLFDNEEDSLKYINDTIDKLNIKVGEQIFKGYPQLILENQKKVL